MSSQPFKREYRKFKSALMRREAKVEIFRMCLMLGRVIVR